MKGKNLKELLFSHNNDYRFDPVQILALKPKKVSNLSIIIPYYETGDLIGKVLHNLYNSIENVRGIYKLWEFEVLIIDDGSINKPVDNYINKQKYTHLKIIKNTENRGRSTSRNNGLFASKYDICLFMDSDILIDTQLILNHLKIHSYTKNKTYSNVVSVSFFEFTNTKNPLLHNNKIHPNYIKLNDYRLHCIYGSTWIGCDEDRKFINKEFKIVEDTNNFRDWRGMYKAWAITNMVLGGFFMVNRDDSIFVGGFDESFRGYGFTETSLPTKLIAIKHHFLIPVLIGGGLHIDDKKINVSRKNKDKIFWEKHDFYFNKYLLLKPNEVIKN